MASNLPLTLFYSQIKFRNSCQDLLKFTHRNNEILIDQQQLIKRELINQSQNMSEEKGFAQKIEDLLYENVNVSSQQVPNANHSERLNDKSLALENLNSLALFPRHSIEKGIPLSKNMLSEDMYPKESESSEQQYEQKHQMQEEKPDQGFVIMEDEQQWVVDQLELPKTSRRKKVTENTKNVLRNFGNAQNQYALYNKEAIQIVQRQISQPHIFYQWIRGLKLQNFEGFKGTWGQSEEQSKLFRRVYKKICWQFYTEAAIPYVLTSRMRDVKTKMSHLKYIYRFLQGLKDPQDFSYFKKVQK